MSRARVAWGGLTALTCAVYALLVWLGNQYLFAGVEELPPFDLRITGYGLQEARAYLEALHPTQVTLYAGPLRWLDTLFPLLFGLWILVTLRALGRPLVARIALVYVALDLAENALIGRMLAQGAEGVSAELVGWASGLTVAKFAAVALALIAIGHAGLRRWGRV